jgi:hypothetical protein
VPGRIARLTGTPQHVTKMGSSGLF